MSAKPQRPVVFSHMAMALAVALTLVLYATRYHRPLGVWAAVFVEGLPTLVILAIATYWAAVDTSRYRTAVAAAFACSLLGSYFMAMPKQQWFLPGVGAFFCANLCYIAAFTSGVRFAARAAPFVVVGLPAAVVMIVAWPHIPGGMKLPLLVYAISIVSVSAQAITRGLVVRRRVLALAAVGATLLLISDSLIAVSLFSMKLPMASLLIGSTYFIGQWLIAASVIGGGAND
jgi:uncharacterized membrane protein YhhN